MANESFREAERYMKAGRSSHNVIGDRADANEGPYVIPKVPFHFAQMFAI